jgi:hypothetical protein
LGDKKMAFEKNETATTGEDDNIRVDFEESSAYLVPNLGSVTPRG